LQTYRPIPFAKWGVELFSLESICNRNGPHVTRNKFVPKVWIIEHATICPSLGLFGHNLTYSNCQFGINISSHEKTNKHVVARHPIYYSYGGKVPAKPPNPRPCFVSPGFASNYTFSEQEVALKNRSVKAFGTSASWQQVLF